MNGYLDDPQGRHDRHSQVSRTALFVVSDAIPLGLGTAIELMANRMIISLLALDGRGIISNRPLLENAALQNTTCTSVTYQGTYRYQIWRLISVYGTLVGIGLLAGLGGMYALHRNGVSSNTNISAIIRATRNPTLDGLMGGCLGGESMSKSLKGLGLKLGEVQVSPSPSGGYVGERGGQTNVDCCKHVALGIVGKVEPIRKGERYSERGGNLIIRDSGRGLAEEIVESICYLFLSRIPDPHNLLTFH